MEQQDTDNTTKNIVNEIVRECVAHKLDIEEHFCTYYVKLLTLDPVWKISPEKKINRDYIQTLVSFIIEKIKLTENTSLTTLKMQQYYLAHCTNRKQMILNHKQQLENSLEPLLDNIIYFVLDDYNRTRLLKRIVLYIALISAMGNPKQNAVIKETFHAMKSVFDENEFDEFTEMKPEQKIQHLNYLQKLVMGIRLFNRDCGRNICDIEDLPKILTESLTAVSIDMKDQLYTTMTKVNYLTSAIENVCKFNEKCSINKFCYIVDLPEEVTMDDLYHAFDLLVLSRQHEVYLRRIILEVKEIHENVKGLLSSLQEVFGKIHNSVKYKIAIAATLAFPLFTDLANIWIGIQQETIIFSTFIQIYKHLKDLASKKKIDSTILQKMIADKPVLTDAERLQVTATRINIPKTGVCQLIDPSEIPQISKVEYEFLGFCITTFLGTQGALIPGNPNMGIINWNDKYYVFATPEAAELFAKYPNEVLMRSLMIVREKPELISLLQLYDQLFQIRNLEISFDEKDVEKEKNDILVQTQLHPIESYIDPKYVWNTWDYFRRAKLLADITTRKTHSSQTRKSNFRNSVHMQTDDPRNKCCQTKRDNYGNSERLSQFIFGLRGRKDDFQHIVDLTRPIDEEYFHTCAEANANKPCLIQSGKCPKSKGTKQSFSNIVEKGFEDMLFPKSVNGEEDDILSCLCVTQKTIIE